MIASRPPVCVSVHVPAFVSVRAHQRGFTLIELIVVISLFGILASVGAALMARPILAFNSAASNARLADAGSLALQRMADELRQSLPNSVRVTASAGGFFLEFIPLTGVGRYRAQVAATGTAGDILDFSDPADPSFDVLGPLPAIGAASQLVIHNLGTPDGDAYLGNNRRGGVALSGSVLQFAPNGAFPAESPSARFALADPPVSFVCTLGAAGTGAGTLRRYSGYGFQASQPVSTSSGPLAGAASALLVDGLGACAAAYGAGLQNLGMVTLSLAMARSESAATLVQQIAVDTTP